MKKVIILGLAALFIAVFLTTPSLAQSSPAIPCAFWGSVTINNSPAPAGTRIEATGNGVLTGLSGNPFTVVQAGQYGDQGALSSKLVVQGDIAEGSNITFLINGTAAQQTAIWHSGSTTKLDLTVVTSSSGGGSGGGGSGMTPQVTLSGFQANGFLKTNSYGIMQAEARLQTIDTKLTLDISKGTKLLNSSNSPLTGLSITPVASPPQAPENNAIVMAYAFGPNGAKFDPPLTLIFAFNPANLPAEVAENGLYIAFFDGTQWQKLESTVDFTNKTVMARVSHFSSYALIGTINQRSVAATTTSIAASAITLQPAPVQTKLSNPSPSVSTTNIPEAEILSNTITQNTSVLPAADPVKNSLPASSPGNSSWGMITGIIVAALLVILVLILVIHKRQSK